MKLQEFWSLLYPLVCSQRNVLGYAATCSTLSVFRLYEWYGCTEELNTLFEPSHQYILDRQYDAYQRTRRALLELSYAERVELIEQGRTALACWWNRDLYDTLCVLVEAGDWEVSEVERWTDTENQQYHLHPLGSLARSSEPAASARLQELVQAGLTSFQAPYPSFYAGVEAWLLLLAYGRLEHASVVEDLRSWRMYRHFSRERYSWKALKYLPGRVRQPFLRACAEALTADPLDEEGENLYMSVGAFPLSALARPVLERMVMFADSTLETLNVLTVEPSPVLLDELRQVSSWQRFLAAKPVTDSLYQALYESFAPDEEAQQLFAFLRQNEYLPAEAVPAVRKPELLSALLQFCGEPGDPLFQPDGQIALPKFVKLARLVVAANGGYDPVRLLEVAAHAYDEDRLYFGHDAVLCAMVHPAIVLDEKRALIQQVSKVLEQRKKTKTKMQQLLRWTRVHGYLPEEDAKRKEGMVASIPS